MSTLAYLQTQKFSQEKFKKVLKCISSHLTDGKLNAYAFYRYMEDVVKPSHKFDLKKNHPIDLKTYVEKPENIILIYSMICSFIERHYKDGYDIEPFYYRTNVIKYIAYGIPDVDAFTKIVDFMNTERKGSKLFSICAGKACIETVFKEIGIDVTCVDFNAQNQHKTMPEHVIQTDGIRFLHESDNVAVDDVLYLSWPSFDSSVGANAVKEFKGSAIIYVGEDKGGCCADDEFFEILETGWTNVYSGNTIHMYGINDTCKIYTRNTE